MDTKDELLREQAYTDLMRNFELESKSFFMVTTEINAIDYLDQSVRFLLETDKNMFAWKWVVISLHGSLYGFCISALRGTNPDLVKTKKKKWIIGFPEALKRCQDIEYMKMGGSLSDKPLILNEKQQKAISIIQEKFRNNFEHFPPMSISLASIDIAENVSYVYEVIEKLIFESNTFLHRIEKEDQLRIKSLCSSGQQIAVSMNEKLNKYIQEYERLQSI